MAVKASCTVTLSCYRDTQSVTRYYKLQSSTSSAPSKPTVNPPSGWDDTEPSYTNGSTNTLYFCDLTVFSDGTWAYSTVSKSSSYEAAKEAYNKAVAAQDTANDTQNSLDISLDVIVGTQISATGSWTGIAKFAKLKDGQRIAYWLPYNGSGNATLNLTLSDGSTTGDIACYYGGTTRIKTQYSAGSVIHLTYKKDVSIAGSSTKYTGWWADANYDSGNTYDRTRYSQAIKAGTTAIVAANIIVAKDGKYTHLKLGNAFDVSYPILYAASAISASATGTNNYLAIPFTITTTQSITLTAYKPVYIKGKLSGTVFTPVSTTPLIQTVPTSEDGYQYILLGTSYSSTGVYLLNEHPIFQYFNGGFKTVQQIATESAKTATNYIRADGSGLVVGNHTGSTLGRNVLIDSDSVDIRNGTNVLATFGDSYVYIGKNSESSVIDMCNGSVQLYHETLDYDETRFVIEPSNWLYLTGRKIYANTYTDDASTFGETFVQSASYDIDGSSGTYIPGGSVTISATSGDCNDRSLYSMAEVTLYPTALSLRKSKCKEPDYSFVYTDITLYDENIQIHGNTELSGGSLIIPNEGTDGYAIFGTDASGNNVSLIGVSSSNNIFIGYGSYLNSQGSTNLYGNDVRVYVKQAGTSFRPYYRKTDTIDVVWRGSGFLTSSSSKIYFTVSLGRPIIGNPTVSVSSGNGLVLRQNNKYTHGSSASVAIKPSSYTAEIALGGGAINVCATMSSVTNAINNSPIGISADIKITFS